VNFLNLEGWQPNPEPPFLDNLWSYRLFRAVRNDGSSGKMIDQNPYDLDACGAFQILGKTGVFSLLHIDHEGAIMCLQINGGGKLWLTWPRESPKELRERTGSSPASRPFAIHVKKFDWLFQPKVQPVRLNAVAISPPHSILHFRLIGSRVATMTSSS
jgi:hypothetical protein